MDAMDWLRQVRKLDGALLDHMGVRKVDHPDLGAALMFPYLRDGEQYAAKFRTVEKAFRSSSGISRGFYNADTLTGPEHLPIVITEGEIDCLSVMQAGFERAVSLPDGWAAQGNKSAVLVDAENLLRASPCVIVAGDTDPAGESLPRTVANVLRGHPVRFAEWPKDCKDPNDVLTRFGEGELARCLNAARLIDPPGGTITGFSDLPPLSARRVLRLGFDPFDRCVAFELGAISVVTGTPGSGKSTFTTWAAHHVARNEVVRIGLLAFETHPHRTRDHLARLNTGRGWGALTATEQENLGQALDRHWRLVHRVYDKTAHHLGWVEDMIHTLATRDGCKLVVIDPWNELEHLPEKGESTTAYLNFALQRIRQIAEHLEIHICIVAHPRKMNTEGRPRAPTGYDVSDSAAYANKPSLGLTVHQATKEDGDKLVELVTWKVRDTLLYRFEPGVTEVDFDPEKQAYRRIM